MTAVVAAIADAPQIPVPTPIRICVSPRTPSSRPSSHAPPSATASVPSMTGNDSAPTRTTWGSDNPVPSTTIDSCSTGLRRPSTRRRCSIRAVPARAAAASPPSRMPNTGPPTIGTNCPSRSRPRRPRPAISRPGATGGRALRGLRPRPACVGSPSPATPPAGKCTYIQLRLMSGHLATVGSGATSREEAMPTADAEPVRLRAAVAQLRARAADQARRRASSPTSSRASWRWSRTTE